PQPIRLEELVEYLVPGHFPHAHTDATRDVGVDDYTQTADVTEEQEDLSQVFIHEAQVDGVPRILLHSRPLAKGIAFTRYHQREPLTVRRPCEVPHATVDVRQARPGSARELE